MILPAEPNSEKDVQLNLSVVEDIVVARIQKKNCELFLEITPNLLQKSGVCINGIIKNVKFKREAINHLLSEQISGR